MPSVALVVACGGNDATDVEESSSTFSQHRPTSGHAPATGDSSPTDEHFLRHRAQDDGSARLETSITRYSDEKGRSVDLVSAIHIGDAAYFDQLDRVFTVYDVVLFEMVKPPDVPVARPEGAPESGIGQVQRAMTRLLDLEFQLDGIDYTAPNFVHADLDPTTFMRLQAERGESIFRLMLQAALAESSDPAARASGPGDSWAFALALVSERRARSLKLVLAQRFGGLLVTAAGLEGPDGESVLITERNKHAMRVLEAQMDAGHDKLALFYGAAHLPDFERRLEALGFTRGHRSWVTAWDVR